MLRRTALLYPKVPASAILSALIVLAGIIVLACGYYGGDRLTLEAGLIITLTGVVLEAFSMIARGSLSRRGTR